MASRSVMDQGVKSNPTQLDLSDCICPICLYIYIEPVTMPCGHELCVCCFKKNVQEASLSCPMCRMRISTWTRRAVRHNKLVNAERWQEIQRQFPEKVEKRLLGIDDEETDERGINDIIIMLKYSLEISTYYRKLYLRPKFQTADVTSVYINLQ